MIGLLPTVVWAKPVRIGTLNLRNWYGGAEFGRDRYLDPNRFGISAKPIQEQQMIANTLNEAQLDFIAIQEIESNQVARRLSQDYLQGRYMTIVEQGADPALRNMGFLVRNDLPYEYVTDFHFDEMWWPPGAGATEEKHLFPRGVATLIVFDKDAAPGSKPKMILMGIHNKSAKESSDEHSLDPVGEKQREAQMERVGKLIDGYRIQYGADIPIIVLGDTNDSTLKSSNPLRNRRLRFANEVAKKLENPNRQYTHVSGVERIRKIEMDRIYVSSNISDQVLSTKVYGYRNSAGQELIPGESGVKTSDLPSDHFLVVAELDEKVLPVSSVPPSPLVRRDASVNPMGSLVAASANDYEHAMITDIKNKLVFNFPTFAFDRETDLLSALFPLLPMQFADFKLNPAKQGFPILFGSFGERFLKGKLSLEETRKLLNRIKEIPKEKWLAVGHLNNVGAVIDLNHIRVVRVENLGRQYLALQTTEDFREWQKKLGSIFFSHFSGEGFTLPKEEFQGVIPILEIPAPLGAVAFSEERIARASAKLEKLIQDLARTRPGGGRTFSLSSLPIHWMAELDDTAAKKLFSIRFVDQSGRVEPPSIIDWISNINRRTVIEIDTDAFLAKNELPIQLPKRGQDYRVFNSIPNSYPVVNLEQFQNYLSPKTRSVYQRGLSNASTNSFPVQVDGVQYLGSPAFVMQNRHPNLAPMKVNSVVGMLEKIGVPQTQNASVGYAVYGSFSRAEFDNPSDVDLLMNVLVKVPNQMATAQQAEDYAVNTFVNEVLDHYRKQARAGKLAFMEMRIGSDATMGVESHSSNPLDAYNENPYLSHQDIMTGKFTDPRTNKTWTLEELIKLGDFTKSKIDYFDEAGKRTELSLQFVLGYDWNGKTFLVRRHGFKGAISSLLSTGVYLGAESYATAAALASSVGYYESQFGDVVARSIGGLIDVAKFQKDTGYLTGDVVWRGKILKQFYASLGFMKKSAASGIDQVFFDETIKFLRLHGRDPGAITLAGLVQDSVRALNQPVLLPLNQMKRIANDLKEFNERNQWITPQQLQSRFDEFNLAVPAMEQAFPGAKMPSSLRTAITDARKVFIETNLMPEHEARVQYLIEPHSAIKTRLEVLGKLEKELIRLEGMLLTDFAMSSFAISHESQEVMQTMIALMPNLYSRYCSTRMYLTDAQLNQIYRAMGVGASEDAVALMKETSSKLMDLSFEDVSARQLLIFEKAKSCREMLKDTALVVGAK